ncbi:MAG TPA: SRPBCC domain-containing protein [Candidatus Acidoferrum sp.]|nr:SRPBCC domain-containing protein [Candidatus Acidoferrum sp.]
MTPSILQRVKFLASPKMLFEMYMDSKKHSAATGAPAKLSRKVGGAWHAHGGAIGGKNLLIIPEQKIVQAWRATHWEKGESSVLILTFEKVPGGSIVDLVHVGVPQHDQEGVRNGWLKYYWKPWKKYLELRKRS